MANNETAFKSLKGFYYRLRKELHILTGVILSAFPSQFGMDIPKTAQEQAAKNYNNPLLKQNLFKLCAQKN